MNTITILGGRDKAGKAEGLDPLILKKGEIYTIVGNTGSGKSRLIKDVEQLADGDSITGRRVLLDGESVPRRERQAVSAGLVAHLGQNMRFMLDISVGDFVSLHARCRGKQIGLEAVLNLANCITPEPVAPEQHLNLLSGGQARALMIADLALICDSPVVLIDEIENAGIDKEKALELLRRQDKLVLVVTHDPHTALMAERRIVMGGGAVRAVVERTKEELTLFALLSRDYQRQRERQTLLRKGEHLI
ncbi:ATP-binding cassette domain-containing protein [Desulfitobacterium chlororespirans]|uniref:ABC-type lipoprotein export system, ATPase component n=1 Tax=Desulfitobacterium chlororespirans DSM 11544 TaxID=1121395 RepID=A0A1M7UY60_9FIRM|nr:ATP-binding cassette domain-containing protein [Desulfitobacterium chlororespirans]SHN87885.1 ABC-type lipoprotein export system, ATPase component [Desulfitobacterium chlororespirans DSM 11544]